MTAEQLEITIVECKINGLPWYRVFVRGVLACEAPSIEGARRCGENYVRKLKGGRRV